jgi:aspartate aminotransferase
MLKAFQERHEYLYNALNDIPGIQCIRADGTFYSFPNVSKTIDNLSGVNDDVELSEYLLNNGGVAVVPGTAFGAPGYIRLSFATSLEILHDAVARIRKALEN